VEREREREQRERKEARGMWVGEERGAVRMRWAWWREANESHGVAVRSLLKRRNKNHVK
jgi:hypothetical protein